MFILLALITIITLLAEEIAKGNAISYRYNYVIFTCVIRLALANSLTGVNISQVILSVMLKLVTGTRPYRYGLNCSQFRGVVIIPPWSSAWTKKKGRQKGEEKRA